MNPVGIIDIGSNTVVLIIYDSISPIHVKEYYSEPVHLVSYNQNGIMKEEGIDTTLSVLHRYHELLISMNINEFYGFITEPWRRLNNADYMLTRFSEAGIPIEPLSGVQEAEYDFYGSRMDCDDILTGNACDIGGGSTELISFHNGIIHEAISLPVGCVRLKELPITPEVPKQWMNKAFEACPGLMDTPSKTLIGIGGTCRAAGLMGARLFPGELLTLTHIKTILNGLLSEDPHMISVMKEVITPGRWSVLAPGLNMLCGVMEAYQAEQLRISEGCVREGYLLHKLQLNEY
ncbi:MAG: hypothetical protein IJ225_05750 [Solobacterium sp.]|nr:hypothetical protein [Solobacterium sp.]